MYPNKLLSNRNYITSIFLTLVMLSGLIVLNFFNQNNFILGDDAWGAAAILGNPYEVIVFTLRWDLHPPLYYSVLDIWAIFGKSDLWLQTSSSFFHASTAGLLFYILRKQFSFSYSIALSLLLLTSPMLLDYSFKVRMYSFIALMSMLLFIMTERYVLNNSKRLFKWILLVGFIISNSHAIGILFVSFHFLYGLLLSFETDKKKIKSWLVSHFFIALLAVPAILNSMFKSVSHAQAPEVDNIFHLLTNIFVNQVPIVGGLVLFCVLMLLTIYKQKSILFFYLVLPVTTFAIISYTVKPLWLDRNFIFTIPIIYVAIGRALAEIKLNFQIKSALVMILFLLNSYMFSFKTFSSVQTNYSDFINFLSGEIESVNKTKKICMVSNSPLGGYWSLQRYLGGYDWGNPFDAQPLINETWSSIVNKLPDIAIKALYLAPKKNYVEYDTFIVSSQYTNRCAEEDIEKVLYIGDFNQSLNEILLFSAPGLNVYSISSE